MQSRHFLSLLDFTPDELDYLIARASTLKARHARGERHAPLPGRVLGQIFEKASTRTRVSFEAGIAQLGGCAIFLSPRDTQLGRGESIEDTAKVLSRMVDLVMIRAYSHDTVARFAAVSRVPVINGLTDHEHPCQLLADIQTFVEHRGPIAGRTVAWVGDGNNMCNSYITAARQFGFRLRIACPVGYEPAAELLADNADRVELTRDPLAAARGADLVTTDVWASMGHEAQLAQRAADFAAYRVDADVMAAADPEAIFLHCLPAHRGEEVTAEVIDGPQSQVWDEAENRMHAQKALMEFLLLGRIDD
ncbi:ornithine carbamoyltransferase [Plasticicumulans lactativorans]|uniref:Ornithine carbamoyltransferase n=1 Tax=Plasticicumulans lactativorans TaxID=1133106 RepID=A0A4R2L7C1_9GAMM|nr:ornithine carbamoyltransferase [Plasticicumulans lactativorans]TCO83389.1 ornithine carbamoyltransferase [Plasticicumulans lactativorans]